MQFTYVQLKQAIQDFTENDSTELTTATGSGIAPIDVIIGLAEERMYRQQGNKHHQVKDLFHLILQINQMV